MKLQRHFYVRIKGPRALEPEVHNGGCNGSAFLEKDLIPCECQKGHFRLGCDSTATNVPKAIIRDNASNTVMGITSD